MLITCLSFLEKTATATDPLQLHYLLVEVSLFRAAFYNENSLT